MIESQSKSWTIGAAFVTASLNAKASRTLGSAPYALMHRTTLEQYATKYHRKGDDSNDVQGSNDGGQVEVYAANKEAADDVSVDVLFVEMDVDTSCNEENKSTNQRSDAENVLPGSSDVFPFSESENLIQTELIRYLSRVKIINNPGKGECLFSQSVSI